MTFLDIVTHTKKLHTFFAIQGTPTPLSIHSDTDMSIKRATVDYEDNIDFIDAITFYKVDADVENTAIYLKYGKQYKILISATKDCWVRFLATKEMCHIYLDQNEEDMTTDVLDLIGKIVSGQMRINALETDINSNIPSEYLTILFAFELLMPYKFNYLLEDVAKTSYEIADMFKIPEAIVDMCRVDWYINLRKEAYKRLS